MAVGRGSGSTSGRVVGVTVIPVADLDDPALAPFLHLTDVALRRVIEPGTGLYLAESSKVIVRALDAGHVPRSMLVPERWVAEVLRLTASFPDLPVYTGTDEQLETITGFHLHRGALAAMARPESPPVADLLREACRVVVLEDIVDHTNVGAIFRAAAGIGADAVLVSERCADPLYRRSVRVSMGTVLQVPWTRMPPWRDAAPMLHAAGFEIAAFALAEGAVPLDDYARTAPTRLALVFGAEGDGLSRTATAAADTVVTIPMAGGVDSLNVASASAVALWALRPPPGSRTASRLP